MTRSVFHPVYYFRSFHDVSPALLKKHGIRLLIVDIDNTLIPSRSNVISEEARAFISDLRKEGIEPIVVSNNVSSRIQKVSDELQVQCFPFSFKPLPFGFRKAMDTVHAKASQTAVLGDQLLTDIWGGNRLGIMTILSDPIASKDNFFGAINRRIENILFRILKSRGIFEKGKYYGKL